jgi:hypothetical protein
MFYKFCNLFMFLILENIQRILIKFGFGFNRWYKWIWKWSLSSINTLWLLDYGYCYYCYYYLDKLASFLVWPLIPALGRCRLLWHLITLSDTHKTHTHTHTHTHCRTPLDEWSAGNKDLYLTNRNTHKRRISVPWAGFETGFYRNEQNPVV